MAIIIHTTSNRVVNKSDMLLLIPIATITITIRNGTNNRTYSNDSSNNSNESSTYKNPICWNNGEGSTSKQNWWYIIFCFSFQPQKTVKQWPIAVGNRLTGHLKLASNNPWGCRLPTIQPFSVQVASPGWDSRCQSTGATTGLPPFFLGEAALHFSLLPPMKPVDWAALGFWKNQPRLWLGQHVGQPAGASARIRRSAFHLLTRFWSPLS